MESKLRHIRRRSGYEPSDTETDWHESPRREIRRLPSDNNVDFDLNRLHHELGTPRRRHSKSPYNPRGETDMRRNVSPLSRRMLSDRNVSPFMMSERRVKSNETVGNTCSYSRSERGTRAGNGREISGTPFVKCDRRDFDAYKDAGDYFEVSLGRDRSGFSKRAASAPRVRSRARGQQISYDRGEHKKEHVPLSPLPDNGVSHKHGPSVGEINEMVAKAKMSSGLNGGVLDFESTDSISPGDIFFSRDFKTFQKNGSAHPREFLPKSTGFVDVTTQRANFNINAQGSAESTLNSSSLASRQSSNISDSSMKTTASTKKFVENRRKGQSDTWFSCINKGSCRKSKKSPEKERPFNEASFISKAVVVESLRPFWADKHRPTSLNGFTCHKQAALLLQKIATGEIFPHILLKGPPGTGKKALAMALLREIYGEPVSNISHDLRYFQIMEPRPMEVIIPVTSSPHHVELNVYSDPKVAYALTALVKKMSSEHAIPPDISAAPLKSDYKVLVLLDVDKATENMQHLIKWIMDCYSDSCKLVLCCLDDVDILESVKSRCKVIEVEPLVTHEVMEVLIQIAKKEGFELPMSFAAKIATKSKHNLRRAIMALEACKAHNHPFTADQPIPLGWEEALIELAADILADPSPKRLFIVRGKMQKLLADFVHPRLILLKLVEQFLRVVEAGLKREVYYWYAYYDKKLPTGTTALLKLEEFVAKVTSIYRKGLTGRKF